MDVPVPQVVEQIVDDPVPQVMEDVAEVVKHIPQARVQNCAVEQFVAVSIPQIRKEIWEVIQLIPQGSVSDLVVEQIVDNPVRQIPEQTVAVANVVPQERFATAHMAADCGRALSSGLQACEKDTKEQAFTVPFETRQEHGQQGEQDCSCCRDRDR